MHSNGFNDDCNVFSHVYVIKTNLTMYYIHHEENKLVEWVWHLITLSTSADTGLLKMNRETNTQTPLCEQTPAYQINPQLVVERCLFDWNSYFCGYEIQHHFIGMHRKRQNYMPFRKWFFVDWLVVFFFVKCVKWDTESDVMMTEAEEFSCHFFSITPFLGITELFPMPTLRISHVKFVDFL